MAKEKDVQWITGHKRTKPMDGSPDSKEVWVKGHSRAKKGNKK